MSSKSVNAFMRWYGLVLFFLKTSVFLLIIHPAYGQGQFKHYTAEEGYTGPGVVQFAQDSLGFLWIRSGGGLFQFDGFDFKVKKANPKDSLSLPYDGGDIITIDPDGQLWAYHNKYLLRYDRDNDGFVSHRLDTSITSLLFDKKSATIWAGTWSGGLRGYNPQTKVLLKYENREGDINFHQKDNTILTLYDRGADLLLGTLHGLWIFDKQSKKIYRPAEIYNNSATSETEIDRIYKIKSNYWLKTATALVKTDLGLHVLEIFYFNQISEKFDHSGKIVDPIIEQIDVDREGVFWISSWGLGLIRLNSENNEMENFRHDPNDPNSLMTDEIRGVFVDRDQNVWVNEFQKGISVLKKRSINFNNFLPGLNISGMQLSRNKSYNQLIVCNDEKGLLITTFSEASPRELIFTRSETTPDAIKLSSIAELERGKNFLWVSLKSNGIVGLPIDSITGLLRKGHLVFIDYDPKNENTISDHLVSELLEDKEGNLWAGTLAHGLNKINLSIPYGKKGSVIRYSHRDTDTSTINEGNWITDLVQEDTNTVWVSTNSGVDLYTNAIFKHISDISAVMTIKKLYDGSIAIGTKGGFYIGNEVNGKYIFDKVDPLADSYITSLQEDKLGRLWLASLEGLFMFDRKTNYLKQFKKGDGLQGSRFTIAGTGSLQTDAGIMIFSGTNGISVFDPLTFTLSQSTALPVITVLKVNNKRTTSVTRLLGADEFLIPHHITSLTDLELNYKQIVFSLEFASMQLTDAQKNLYRYKLEGFDQQWIQTDWKNRVATYTNLDPGDYVFHLKASNYDGIWSDKETILNIHILPPPWKTWWAYSFYGVLFTGVLLFARRVTVQRERLVAKVKLDQIELEKAHEVDRLKSAFFTNISHEFRTPLTLIKGPAQSLAEELSDNPRVVKKLVGIQENADQLLKLINQLLELSRMESGTVAINNTEGNLTSYLNRIAQSFSSHAAQKGISYRAQGLKQSIVAQFDADKVEVIIINLIFNAIKFSKPGGSVLLNMELKREDNRTSVLNINVIDTGIGIKPDELDRIFDRFYQVNTSHHEMGTGIGLSLVKELTELLGGSIQVKSKPGEGSEFTLRLPVEIISENPEVFNADLNHQIRSITKYYDEIDSTEGKLKILVVEDNAALRSYLIELLGEDYDYLQADNGKAGLQIAIDLIPEMIITDVMMPEMNGFEMIGLLKTNILTSHIPTLVLTAKGTEEDKLSGLDHGADDYLTKPFNKNELALKVKNTLALRVRLRERMRHEIEAETTEPKIQTVEEEFLMKVKEAIRKRISDEQLSVESLAKEIGVSRVQLYRKITALTGLTVIDLIRSYRLQYAARLLKKGERVSQVAYEVGFSNHSHFSRIFKDKYGVLPSEYR